MNNKIIFVASLLLGLVAACNDGTRLQGPAPQPSESCNVIASAYKVGEDAADAVTGDISITAGEGVVLVWSASGAHLTSGTITSEPAEVVGSPVQLQITEREVEGGSPVKESVGSQQFAPLSANVRFTVTGTSQETGKEATQCEGHVNVTVTPAPETLAINSFTATPAYVTPGQSAELCWDVVPTSAAISIVDGDGNALTPPAPAPVPAPETTGGATGAMQVMFRTTTTPPPVTPPPVTEPAEPAASGFAASGCVDVSPTANTTYTLTATTADGQNVTATATVEVGVPQINIVSFTANGSRNLTLTEAGEVTLAWNITPSDATVTIDNGIGSVTSSGSQTVNISANTTYTLTASVGNGAPVTEQVIITIETQIAQLAATVLANATEVFLGEEVTLTWQINATNGVDIPSSVSVSLDKPDGKQSVTGNSATITPSVSGAYAVEVTGPGGVVRSNQINISVRVWQPSEVIGNWVSVGEFDNYAVYGKQESLGGGKAHVGRVVGGGGLNLIEFDYATMFKNAFLAQYRTESLSTYAPYNLNAFARDPASGTLYGAMTGMLLKSTDSGASWSTADIFVMPPNEDECVGEGPPELRRRVCRVDADSDPNVASYPSCKGRTQNGDATGEKIVANLVQLCDVTFDNGRIILATDHGAFYMDNIDEYVANRETSCWTGGNLPGINCLDSDPNQVFGKVVSAVIVNDGKVYAGTNEGVFKSDDRATGWTAVNGGEVSGSTAIYALAASGNKLYAGGAAGVYSADIGSSSWTKLSGVTEAVYSIATEPSGAVYVGTANGVFVTRDAGQRWANITASMGAGDKAVYGLSTGARGVYAATNGGAFASVPATTTINIQSAAGVMTSLAR